MQRETVGAIIGFLAIFVVCAATTVSALADPSSETGGKPEITEVLREFPNITQKTAAKLQGAFVANEKLPKHAKVFAQVKIEADKSYDWHEVPVVQNAEGRMINFALNFRASEWVPQNFKGKAIVRVTSNAAGSFQGMAQSQKD